MEALKRFFIRPPFAKRFILMLVGVIAMGVCVAFLDLTDLGTDPYSALNLGLSRITPISFGTWELLVNGLLLIIVLFFDKSKLGLGTVGNMVVIGYTKDFVSFILEKYFSLTVITDLKWRIIVMLIAVFFFIVAVALYVNAGLGSSAYDALPYVIHSKLNKVMKKGVRFSVVRILFDLFFTLVAYLIKGEAGIITVIMVFTLGPMIELMSKIVSKVFKIDNDLS